jgi:hypothetical protein
VVSLFAGTKGHMDDLPKDEVARFEAELLEEFRTRHSELLDQIKSEGTLPDEDALTKAIQDFSERFQTAEEKAEAEGNGDKKDSDKKDSGEKDSGEKAESNSGETAESNSDDKKQESEDQ